MKSSHRTLTRQVGFSGSDSVVYEDLQTAISAARAPAAIAPVWRSFDYGIGGGVAFETLGFAIGKGIDFTVQTYHRTKLSTVLDNHIHWTIPSDSASDRIKLQLDVIAAPVGSDYAQTAGTPYTAEYVLVGDESGKHNLLDLADIPAVNTTISTMYKCRLTRIAASASDYAGEVYIDFVDCHTALDTMGSLSEGTKT